MEDFNLDDAVSGQSNASGMQSQSQGQNWNPWGGPGQPYPGGYPAPGQQYPGFPPGGQQYPGGAPPPGGQQYPGGAPPPGGQQYPGGAPPPGGQQYPGGPPPGQQYPGGAPPPGGQQYPGGFPGFPGFPGQQFPGAPGQPADPKIAGQSGPVPSAPSGPLQLPYTLPLPAGIMPGLVLTVQGVVHPNAKRWSVDFKNNNDICFHFNPRFDEKPNVIVCNSMIQGRWGAEERTAPKFPFLKGQQFLVQFFCEQEQYRVAVNNETIFRYKHRSRDFQNIKAVHIGGDITLNGATAGMM